MKRGALLLLLLAACPQKEPAGVDAGTPVPAPASAAAPRAEDVELDTLRLRPCTLARKADDSEAAVACGREWAETYPGMKDHVRDPKWVCTRDEKAYELFFESTTKDKDAFVLAEVYRPFMTISPHEYHPLFGGPKAPECKERKTVAPKDGAPRIPAPPPSVADAVRVATEHVRSHVLLFPGGPARPAGHCAIATTSLPPRCESLAHDRWVVFSQPPQVTFFVRVNAALEARFDDPWPDSTATTNLAPWKRCGCESLPGFDVHLQRLVKPLEPEP